MSGSCHFDRASNVRLGVECQIFVIVILLTACEFYNLGHIQGILGCIKEIIFSNLYYFQICFLCQLKESKQTFNTKFVIVPMT